jgi:hypothetical protein
MTRCSGPAEGSRHERGAISRPIDANESLSQVAG